MELIKILALQTNQGYRTLNLLAIQDSSPFLEIWETKIYSLTLANSKILQSRILFNNPRMTKQMGRKICSTLATPIPTRYFKTPIIPGMLIRNKQKSRLTIIGIVLPSTITYRIIKPVERGLRFGGKMTCLISLRKTAGKPTASSRSFPAPPRKLRMTKYRINKISNPRRKLPNYRARFSLGPGRVYRSPFSVLAIISTRRIIQTAVKISRMTKFSRKLQGLAPLVMPTTASSQVTKQISLKVNKKKIKEDGNLERLKLTNNHPIISLLIIYSRPIRALKVRQASLAFITLYEQYNITSYKVNLLIFLQLILRYMNKSY